MDAMIAGAQKSGTSSLAYYVGQHPAICTHARLELSYFVSDLDYALGYASNFERYYGHCDADQVLLGKSVTVMTDPALVARMHDHNPAMRLVVVLRNPVERAYSAYWWARRKGYENLDSFEEALDADPARHHGNVVRVRSTSYIPFGHYADQLDFIYRCFPRDQVQVHLFEDLKANAAGACARIFSLLGVDPGFVPDVAARRNTGAMARSSLVARLMTSQFGLKRAIRRTLPTGMAEGWKRSVERWNRVPFRAPPMAAATRERLIRQFEAPNARLAKMINRDLSPWSSPDPQADTADDS
jgi:hypothetical protein